ncbi:autotransporter outer membrane beta-barrel domain-containing protein [Selenomonas sp. AB3002]|uniref:autotransporter outer membrane beta-barrel domain-containing protein n=1 Tax=Selenomonas sp. AB3002 TaxID=1392502 RepID=UPI000497370E
MRKSKKLAIMAAMTAGVAFGSPVEAFEPDSVDFGGRQFIDFAFLNTGEKISTITDDSGSGYALPLSLRDATKSATSYWSEMLGPRSRFTSPWQIIVVTQDNYQNANAITASIKDGNTVHDNYVAQMLQGKIKLDYLDIEKLKTNSTDEVGTYAFSTISIGQHFGANRDGAPEGWWVDSDTVLPTNEQAADFVGCFRHELVHALGVSASIEYCDWNGKEATEKVTYVDGVSRLALVRFTNTEDKEFWNRHLVDQNGNHGKPGMMIVSTEGFKLLKAKNPDLKESDCFIVDPGNFAYFVGDNVTDALAGATFNGVSGIPTNAFEMKRNGSAYKEDFEGSHFQTAGVQSHRSYTNYTAFMEVELAALQDLGYDFDRKAYFGRSVYGNGLTIDNTQGYSARNSNGTAYLENTYSQVPLGIGLHVYGTNNNITQSADILTQGAGATGIRVDGEGNTINVPASTEIHGDGYRGKGILFAYGCHQNLNLAGNVTANGAGGNAVEFNFGSSSNGALDEYRGSYIRYSRGVSAYTGEITKAENKVLNDMNSNTYNASADELKGELITDFNLSGKISGRENAIYIGRNAFVKNINVKKGAEISGAITSDWKHFSEEQGIFDTEKNTTYQEKNRDTNEVETKNGIIKPLMIQYNGGEYAYADYIPDLVTNLNFDMQDGAMLYQGNVSGSDNMKMNVKSGDLVYTGTADVVNVNVSKGAGLFGGTYTVNDMTSRMADGFSDDTTGKFINHGTIGAYSGDTSMSIKGNLVSDGTLSAYGGGSQGHISVSSTAKVDGSTISATNALPDETLTVLKAGAVTGTLANPDGKLYAATGMLSTTGAIEGNTVKVRTYSANNLGELTAEQAEVYDAMETMQKSLLGDARRNEMRSLYSLSPSAAKRAFTEISSSSAPQMASLVQQSTVASRVISDRLSTAFSTRPVEVTFPVSHFADGGEEKGIKMRAELPLAQDNNAWVKFTKNWGDLRGGANYHGSAVSGGYDRMLNENWRGGVFLSYQTMGLGAPSSRSDIYDTRFGVYAGYHKDAADAYLYADYGWTRNKLRRGVGLYGLGAEARYNSRLVEIGGEYKYDLHANDGRTWHVSPYVNLQLSWLNQKAYAENGAGIFNQHVAGKHNTYFAGQLGVELKRYLKRGSYGMRLGVKHAFVGADPELSFSYEGNDDRFYTLRNNQDKTHFIFSLSGETEFAKGWFLNGEAQLQKGAHDKDIFASVQFKRVW